MMQSVRVLERAVAVELLKSGPEWVAGTMHVCAKELGLARDASRG